MNLLCGAWAKTAGRKWKRNLTSRSSSISTWTLFRASRKPPERRLPEKSVLLSLIFTMARLQRSFWQLLVVSTLCLGACSSYRQNLMLKTPEDFKSATVSKEVREAERNYVIQKNDLLQLDVYANKGERIIDPNPQLSQGQLDETPQK